MALNPNPATGLNITVYSIATENFLEQLLAFAVEGANDVVDAHGIADYDSWEQVVKQGQKLTFRQKMASALSGQNAQSALNITSWSVGSEYVGKFRSGTIKVSITAPDLKIAANAYKTPWPTQRKIEVTGEFIIQNNSALTQTLLGGVEASFSQALSIVTAFETFAMTGVLKTSSQSGERAGIQVEKATWGQQGIATSPTVAITSLLSEACLGTGRLALAINTGYGAFASPTSYAGLAGVGVSAVLTELTNTFADGALIEQSGTLEIQGPLGVTAAS